MLPYFILIIYWAIVSCLYYIFIRSNSRIRIVDESQKRKTLLIFFMCIGLILIMGLRSTSVGSDTYEYYLEYKNAYFDGFNNSYIENVYNESGRWFIIDFFQNTLGIPWQLYLFANALLVSYALGKFILKYSSDVFMSFYLHLTYGFFAMSMSGIRQTIAISLLLLAYMYVCEKKYIKYAICILLAAPMHFSAIFGLILLIFPFFRRYNSKWMIFFLVLPFIARLMGSYVIDPLLPYLPVKYDDYLESAIVLNSLVEIVDFVVLFFCFILIVGSKSKIDIDTFRLFILLSLYVSCVQMSHTVYIASRLSFYFESAAIVLLPNVLSLLSKKDIQLAKILKFACYILFLMYFVISVPDDKLKLCPYTTFLNN